MLRTGADPLACRSNGLLRAPTRQSQFLKIELVENREDMQISKGVKINEQFETTAVGMSKQRQYIGYSNKKANFPPILTLGAFEFSRALNVKIGIK